MAPGLSAGRVQSVALAMVVERERARLTFKAANYWDVVANVSAKGEPGESMVWYGMVWYGMVWYGMVWYGMVWYGMVWYGMVWYGMVWYGTYNPVVKIGGIPLA